MKHLQWEIERMSSMRVPTFTLTLPDWIDEEIPETSHRFTSVESRMALVTHLAKVNVQQAGGPFAAAVFNLETQELVAPGVNLVVPLRASIAHAEIVAVTLAEQVLGHFTLNGPDLPSCELVTSTEPCAMCLGAIPWAGVRRLVCGAREADALAIGFDEGPKPADWQTALKVRGIDVVQDVGRDANIEVLQAYVRAGGMMYNGATIISMDS